MYPGSLLADRGAARAGPRPVDHVALLGIARAWELHTELPRAPVDRLVQSRLRDA